MRPNSNLKSPNLKTYIQDENGINILEYSPQNCHYLHEDGKILASISICTPNNVVSMICFIHISHPLNMSILARIDFLGQYHVGGSST